MVVSCSFAMCFCDANFGCKNNPRCIACLLETFGAYWMIEPKPKEKGYTMDEKYARGISCMRQKIREYYEKTYLGVSTSAPDGIFGHPAV